MRLPGLALMLLLLSALAFANAGGAYTDGTHIVPDPNGGDSFTVQYKDGDGNNVVEGPYPCRRNKAGEIVSAPPYEARGKQEKISRPGKRLQRDGTFPNGEPRWKRVPKLGGWEGPSEGKGEGSGTLPQK